MKEMNCQNENSKQEKITFFQRSFFVLFQPFNGDSFKSDSGGWIFLQNIPHVFFRENEQVAVADRTDRGCSPVA